MNHDPRLPGGDPNEPLPTAHGGAPLLGRMRELAEDFVVEEQLGYTASGTGEHDFLVVRKRDRNTHDVARLLARHAGVAQVAVGYAGLKDRRAVTTQHFSVQLPGRASPDWSQLDDDDLQVLEVGRHHRKIRRGSLRGNRFRIRIRAVEGDRAVAEQRLSDIAANGVPNYFGSQRFGNAGRNLGQVADLFAGRGRRPRRELRGLLLSAARAHLFNAVLASRVDSGTWNDAIPGEVLMLEGSQRQFAFDPADPSIGPRLVAADVHPSGPLCGRPSRALLPDDAALRIEEAVVSTWADWIDGLQRFGLDADRRALRLVVQEPEWQWDAQDLVVGFALPAGAYATSVLREVVRAPASEGLATD
jgi:tRNA pseudouridine13 synthase